MVYNSQAEICKRRPGIKITLSLLDVCDVEVLQSRAYEARGFFYIRVVEIFNQRVSSSSFVSLKLASLARRKHRLS